MPNTTHKLAIISRDAEAYSALLAEQNLPELEIIVCAQSADNVNLSKIELLLSEPSIAAQIVPRCDRLKWMQSTWAGNNPLIQLPKRDYILTGVKGIFGAAMREYVFAYLLYFERNIALFSKNHGLQNTTACQTRWTQPPVGTLAGKRLGILGAGSIASELVSAAKVFGMQIVGANYSGKSDAPYDVIYPIDKLEEFTLGLDYMVCMLPDTPQTQHIVNTDLLSLLSANCVLINAGRGSTIDDSALIEALNKRQIKAAVLDVFETEPLPDQHPYWHMDNVYVTQHTAAISEPSAVFEVFTENYKRWRNQRSLKHIIDFTRGY